MSNKNTSGKKVALGLSGGVDSSVAAFLLKEQGFDVTGVYMQCWEESTGRCSPDPDKASAIQAASLLNIKFEELDFIKAYKDKVIDYFYSEYKAGRTPNPDIMCNREIKFGLFFNWALNNGFDYVATGHYAQVLKPEILEKSLDGISSLENIKGYGLGAGEDPGKDQSYFLYVLDREHLQKTMFPLGEMLKKDVRKLARKIGLHNAERPDSTGICFIGEVDIVDFLKRKIAFEKGDVIDQHGNVIGSHNGVWFYTIGQRHGFDIDKYQGIPLFIIEKDIDKNRLVVGDKKDAFKKKFSVSDSHWISGEPEFPFSCKVRIRHLGKFHDCIVAKENSNLSVKLQKPIFAVAPGQSAVFYYDGVVLGGGIIK